MPAQAAAASAHRHLLAFPAGPRSGLPGDADFGDRAAARAGEEFRVALCAPLGGPEGIWGPSCLASARLAQDELNRWSGIAGRSCELEIVDASAAAGAVEARLAGMAERREVDAIVGMCISSVRQRIVGAVRGRVPFVYTCLYEGGDASPGLYAIGETAQRQLEPAIAWLAAHRRARRWCKRCGSRPGYR